ncbi:MAG: hypothetical protein V7K40_06070 [Nostoc sp.]|uniref:hypothetical protein n=1 Tax=Nostoc sp. TaxID=1180 RepID=UPI002FF6BE9F
MIPSALWDVLGIAIALLVFQAGQAIAFDVVHIVTQVASYLFRRSHGSVKQ